MCCLQKNWRNKTVANRLELTWYGKDEPICIELCLLIENAVLSDVVADPDTENILILGYNQLITKDSTRYCFLSFELSAQEGQNAPHH